jgi:hypothetical protein
MYFSVIIIITMFGKIVIMNWIDEIKGHLNPKTFKTLCEYYTGNNLWQIHMDLIFLKPNSPELT